LTRKTQIRTEDKTHVSNMADLQPIVIRMPDSFVFHTANPFSDPSIQRRKLTEVCSKPLMKVIDSPTDNRIELLYHRCVEVVISFALSLNFLSAFGALRMLKPRGLAYTDVDRYL
jgi:hypothetical protein